MVGLAVDLEVTRECIDHEIATQGGQKLKSVLVIGKLLVADTENLLPNAILLGLDVFALLLAGKPIERYDDEIVFRLGQGSPVAVELSYVSLHDSEMGRQTDLGAGEDCFPE